MKHIYVGMFILFVGYCSTASASISLSGTRLIYNQTDTEASINVSNNGKNDVLIQSWLEADDKSSPPPFAMTPPLAKVAGDQRQVLRVFYQGEGLPQDRESVFWINVQEIPQTATGKNVIQLAVLQRIKLFFRPSGLDGDARSAPLKLTGQLRNGQLEIKNSTPYHINFITLKQADKSVAGKMIPPYQAIHIATPTLKSDGEISLIVINDYGATQTLKGYIKSGELQALSYMKRQ